MQTYMSHPKNASGRYRKSKRSNFHDDVKGNVFAFPGNSLMHHNEQNPSVDEEVCTNARKIKALESSVLYDVKENKFVTPFTSIAAPIEEQEACPTPKSE